MEVVCYLGQDASPVDRVDRGELVRFVDLRIGEEGLNKILEARLALDSSSNANETYLTVVKGPIYSKVMHIGVHDCGHLGLLNGADFSLRMHDEYRHILLPT